jgi:hypothetical protein
MGSQMTLQLMQLMQMQYWLQCWAQLELSQQQTAHTPLACHSCRNHSS